MIKNLYILYTFQYLEEPDQFLEKEKFFRGHEYLFILSFLQGTKLLSWIP